MASKKTPEPGGKRALRWAALRSLSERHPDEFHELLGKAYAEAGLVYERPVTPEEKAQATIDELLTKYPSLRGRIAPVVQSSAAVGLLAGDDDDDELVPDMGTRIDPSLSRAGKN